MEVITIKMLVDGEEQAPISMRDGLQDVFYKDEIAFFSMGSVYNKEKSVALYDYTIRLTRHKTDEEMRLAPYPY